MQVERIEIVVQQSTLVRFKIIDGTVLAGEEIQINGRILGIQKVSYEWDTDKNTQTMTIYVEEIN